MRGYLAFDKLNGIEVAWNKMSIRNEIYYKEGQCSEVELLKSLKHKNIIKYHHSWVVKGSSYVDINIITEIFTSGTLKEYRAKHQIVGMKAIKSWARQILRGLVYLHSQSIVHRDLKCDNIFVNGNNGEVKIGDLGLALVHKANQACSTRGTIAFMAPEMFDGEYSEAVDIYAFGMCILEIVTMQTPFSECTSMAATFKKVMNGRKPAALEKVTDPEIRRLILNCIAKDPEKRPSAQDLLDDPWLAEEPPTAIFDAEEEDIDDNLGLLKLETVPQQDAQVKPPVRREFKVEGMQHEDSFYITVHIFTNGKGTSSTLEFNFNPATDTPHGVALEMCDVVQMSEDEISLIAGLIQAEVMSLVAACGDEEPEETVEDDELFAETEDFTEDFSVPGYKTEDGRVLGFVSEPDIPMMETDEEVENAWTSAGDLVADKQLFDAVEPEVTSMEISRFDRSLTMETESSCISDDVPYVTPPPLPGPTGGFNRQDMVATWIEWGIPQDDDENEMLSLGDPGVELSSAGVYDTGQDQVSGDFFGSGYLYRCKDPNDLTKNGLYVTAGGFNQVG